MKNKLLYLSVLIILITFVIPNIFAITGSITNSRMVIRTHTGEIVEKSILIINKNEVPVNISLEVKGDLKEDIQLSENNFKLQAGEEKIVDFTIFINQSGESESEILVSYTPSDGIGNGVSLSSTIIVLSDILDIIQTSNEGFDKDGDGLYEYLIVNTESYINDSANYKIDIRLNLIYSNTSSDYIKQESFLYLERGNYLIPINFSGYSIYNGKLDGPYLLELSLYNLDSGNVISKQLPIEDYNYTNFEQDLNDIQINVNLSPETPRAIAGREVKFIAEFKNIGNIRTNNLISVFRNSDWSNLTKIYPQAIALEPGESKNVEIIFYIDYDAIGEKKFTIKTIYGEDDSEEENISLVVEQVYNDTNRPVILLTSPSDIYSTKSKIITFTYIPKDESNITKCDLIIDGIIKESNNFIINNTENSFSYTLSTGNYNWQINCVDTSGNSKLSETRSLEIEKKSSSSSSSKSKKSYPSGNSKVSFIPLKKDNENKNEQIYQKISENNIITLGNSEVKSINKNDNRKINTNFLLLVSLVILFSSLIVIIILKD